MTLVLDIQAGADVASVQQTTAREVDEPEVAARAWAMADLRSGEYLVGEGASKELPTASTTKIMTALVVLEKADLDEGVTAQRTPPPTRRRLTAISAFYPATL